MSDGSPSSPLKKSFGRRNWPLHAQLDRVNTRKSRRLPPFAAADLDAKRPVFGSKHFFNRLLASVPGAFMFFALLGTACSRVPPPAPAAVETTAADAEAVNREQVEAAPANVSPGAELVPQLAANQIDAAGSSQPGTNAPPIRQALASSEHAPEFEEAGVCSRCHVVSVLEWDVSAHVEAGTTCQECHGESSEHVANERNEVKPDRLPRGAEIAALCTAECHDDGCPETLKFVTCEECHHVHALVDPTQTELSKDEQLKSLFERWQNFRATIERGDSLMGGENWAQARAAFEEALEMIPESAAARERLGASLRRLAPEIPGFVLAGDEYHASTGLPRKVSVAALDVAMVLVPPGSFDMGADDLSQSQPAHTVRVEPFYLSVTEVTQATWKRVMGSNPSFHQGSEFPDADTMPVDSVSWEDCQVFLDKVNSMVSGGGFRLPTEAEWEYACRLGGRGEATAELSQLAWFRPQPSAADLTGDRFRKIETYSTRVVASLQANAWGLHDMQGNVWEWCSSLAWPYLFDANDGRESPTSAGLRVVRGGSYADGADILRPEMRHAERPHRRYRWNGLRVARSVPQPSGRGSAEAVTPQTVSEK